MSDAARWIVSGRVQGVFFRAFTSDRAKQLGLDGWVRNEADGTVEVFAQGAPAELDELERALHEGPPDARVRGVERLEAEPESGIRGFTVRP
jgi:acylphosphatase